MILVFFPRHKCCSKNKKRKNEALKQNSFQYNSASVQLDSDEEEDTVDDRFATNDAVPDHYMGSGNGIAMKQSGKRQSWFQRGKKEKLLDSNPNTGTLTSDTSLPNNTLRETTGPMSLVNEDSGNYTRDSVDKHNSLYY